MEKERQDLIDAMTQIRYYCDSQEDCGTCMFFNPTSYPLSLCSDETFGCYIKNEPYKWIVEQFKGE